MATEMEATNLTEVVELLPNYKIPIFILLGACALSFVSIWLAAAIALFGLFLTVQTTIIRLQFTDKALNVFRSGKMIRSFPYSEWSNWEIFWQPVPILFYFKEVNSIHFLPIIFDPKTLSECLQQHYPR